MRFKTPQKNQRRLGTKFTQIELKTPIYSHLKGVVDATKASFAYLTAFLSRNHRF